MKFGFTIPFTRLLLVLATTTGQAAVIFETTTPHHHIQVLDESGRRILSFNGSQETRMSLANPLQGHFEYTEFFHMPWLWNPNLTNVLMVGLGGGSSQRSYLHYYPQVNVDTVEIDPTVRVVAERFFHLPETTRHRIIFEDGRMFLRRSQKTYDVILLDAYRTTRYGSFIPYHLATQEFFEITRERLGTNGVVAFNVIGTEHGWRADILGATFRTMKTVFPQVYLFPARDSMNVVLVATMSDQKVTELELRQRADALVTSRKVTLPTFRARAAAFRTQPPRTAARSPVLTDDFAPVDGLLTAAKR
jgi:spermidine synthase